ncbi:NAD-dependent epimerase/dehydratase family protein [Flavobacterium cerinum]|uniref:NAD-dependent epimerase/dehydratase family protein n=1 Tax=Flavobacterium cerinum TaxID=2502784 RepID=A0ABY5IWU5_9FLAO|nr:NAD-dependent epimerase/dehydratase family protein [Flavobacterium cerinum]UUC45936.1 NAD-dependent epimerase/dehydratase family protein [Flavobacterium cerinum]
MILVTGGTGLVGAYLLLDLLQKGESVRAIYRTENNIALTRRLFEAHNASSLFDQIDWFQADITDVPRLGKAFRDIDYVYHCAALISFDPKDEENLRKTNIEGTANIVNCALDFKVKKLCHVSSIAALGDAPEGQSVITEETDWNPEKLHGDYAITKFGAEMEVWRASQEGLNVVVVNPGIIFGSGFWNNGSGQIFKQIASGFPFYSKGQTGVIAIEDVIHIMTALMNSSVSGERFTLVAENLPLNNILFAIADGMSKKRPSFYASPLATSIAWRIDWLLSAILFRKRSFTKATAKSAHSQETFSQKKIVQLLNYSFIPMESYLTTLAQKYATAHQRA